MSTTKTTAIPTGSWQIDPVHSRVEFEVDHLGVSPFRGGFRDYGGKLVAGETGELAVEGYARVDSVSVEGDLRAHLLSPDFFDAERHPEIRFRSSGFELADDGEIRLRGELTIRDRTEAIEAKGRIGEASVNPTGASVVPVALEASVDRHDFGLGWNMELPNGRQALGAEVRLLVALELVAEEEQR